MRNCIAILSHCTFSVLAMDIKFELRYRLLTKGKLNKALAIEISLRLFALVISILLSTKHTVGNKFHHFRIWSAFGIDTIIHNVCFCAKIQTNYSMALIKRVKGKIPAEKKKLNKEQTAILIEGISDNYVLYSFLGFRIKPKDLLPSSFRSSLKKNLALSSKDFV